MTGSKKSKGAQIIYANTAQAPLAEPRAALDTVFADGDPVFRMAGGVVTLLTREYNELNAKYGSAWNWCKAYGLRVVSAHQRDDGKVDVQVEEMEAHLARGQNPDGTDILVDAPDTPPDDGGEGAQVVYAR